MRDNYRRIFSWSVSEGGAGLLDSIETADRQYGLSVLATLVLVKAIKDKEELSIERHKEECRHVRRRGRIRQAEEDADERRAILERISGPQARAVERAPKNGAWLTATPCTLNATVLTAGEFRDGLALRY